MGDPSTLKPISYHIKEISAFHHVFAIGPKSLWFYAAAITDQGLRHLESMPRLRVLRMDGASKITDAGVERLKQVHPKLKIRLT